VSYGALYYGFSVLLTKAAAGEDFSISLLSAAFGGSVLTGGAASILIGHLADRRGVREIIGLGSLLGGLGLAAFAAAVSPWQVLVVWWLILGPVTAMTFYEPAYVAIGQWCAPSERPKAVATMTLLAGFSGPVFVPATRFLVEAVGWRPATVLLGVILAITGGLCALLVLPGRPCGTDAAAGKQPRLSLRALLTQRFVGFTLGALLAYGALEASVVHRIARFEETGFAVSTISAWAALSGLLTLPGRFVLPSLGRQYQGTRILCGVFTVIAAATAFAVRGTTTWEMASYFCLFGLVFGAALPLRAVIMNAWYAGDRFGTIMGVQAAVIAIARAGGPAMVGALRDALGSYRIPMVGILLALLIGGAMVLLSPRLRLQTLESQVPAAR
jgi:MFS family permease